MDFTLPNKEQVDEIIALLAGQEDVYGVYWDKEADEVVRIGASADFGLTYTADSGTTTITGDFDGVFPWAGMKRCNVADDKSVLAYYGDPNYAEDGSNGQVMVEIPKFYYRCYRANGRIYWFISPTEKALFKVHPAFVRDSTEKDFIYFSAFEGCAYDTSISDYLLADEQVVDFDVTTGDVLSSIAGAQPLSGLTQDANIVKCRQIAQNRGADWELQSFLVSQAVLMLFVVEHATLNWQSATEGLNIGITNLGSGTGNHSQNTGHTSHLGNHSGWTTILSANLENGATGGDTYPNSYRGIENFFGNIYTWEDGVNMIGYDIYIADHDFASDTSTDPYEFVGNVPAVNGYIGDIIVDQRIDFGFLPRSIDGSQSSDFHDYWYQVSGNRVFLRGGRWNTGATAGGFLVSAYNSSSYRSQCLGARLALV